MYSSEKGVSPTTLILRKQNPDRNPNWVRYSWLSKKLQASSSSCASLDKHQKLGVLRSFDSTASWVPISLKASPCFLLEAVNLSLTTVFSELGGRASGKRWPGSCIFGWGQLLWGWDHSTNLLKSLQDINTIVNLVIVFLIKYTKIEEVIGLGKQERIDHLTW